MMQIKTFGILIILLGTMIFTSCAPRVAPVPTLATPDEATYTFLDNGEYQTYNLHLVTGHFNVLTMTFSSVSDSNFEYNVDSNGTCDTSQSLIADGIIYFLHCTFKFSEDYQDVSFNLKGSVLYSIATWDLKNSEGVYKYLEYP